MFRDRIWPAGRESPTTGYNDRKSIKMQYGVPVRSGYMIIQFPRESQLDRILFLLKPFNVIFILYLIGAH